MLLAQTRFSPHRRARIQAYLTQEGSPGRLQCMIKSLNTFLHLSIFMFLLGLITMASGGDSAVIVSICLYTAIPLDLYLWYSLMPFPHPHTITSNLFHLTLHLVEGIYPDVTIALKGYCVL